MIPASVRLRRALHLRSLSLVRRLILSNPHSKELVRNVDLSDNGNTSLHIAAELGLLEIAKFLIAQGHESECISRNLDGVTPLMIAAQAGEGSSDDDSVIEGRIAVGKLLVETFPECVEMKDRQGMDAFSHAARHGTIALLSYILSTLSPPSSSQSSSSLPTTLSKKPSGRSRSHIQLLQTSDLAGNTPLHQASAFGHLKTLRLLVTAGADASARNNAHWTPLDYSYSVAAEVYLRDLVKQREQRNVHTAKKHGGVRLVESDDDGVRGDAGQHHLYSPQHYQKQPHQHHAASTDPPGRPRVRAMTAD